MNRWSPAWAFIAALTLGPLSAQTQKLESFKTTSLLSGTRIGYDALSAAMLLVLGLFLLLARREKQQGDFFASLAAFLSSLAVIASDNQLLSLFMPGLSSLKGQLAALGLVGGALSSCVALRAHPYLRFYTAMAAAASGIDLMHLSPVLLSPLLVLAVLAKAVLSLKFKELLPVPEAPEDKPQGFSEGMIAARPNREDALLLDEIRQVSAVSFSILFTSLDEILGLSKRQISLTLGRGDAQLRELYLTIRSYQEVSERLGLQILSQRLSQLAGAYLRPLQDLNLPWTPVFIAQVIEDLRRLVRHYLRISSLSLGRQLESVAELSISSHGFKHEDLIHSLKEYAGAREVAQAAFDAGSWTDLQSAVQGAMNERVSIFSTKVEMSGHPLRLSYQLRKSLESILSILSDNAIRHAFEPSAQTGEQRVRGKMSIHIINQGQELRLLVEDNGLGLFYGNWLEDSREEDGRNVGKLSQEEYARRLLSPWRAPRGLARLAAEVAALEGDAEIVLHKENGRTGYSPFAIHLTLPLYHFRSEEQTTLSA